MQKQAQQKAQHDYHAKYQEFQIGQKVMVRSMHMRPGPAWIPREVIQKLGPVTYLVEVANERPWKCHVVNQLKERVDVPTLTVAPNTPEQPATVDFDFTSISMGEPVPDREPSLDPDPPALEAGGVPDVPLTRVASPPPPTEPNHPYPLRDRARHQRVL